MDTHPRAAVTHVALTGAGCSGKTVTLAAVAETLRSHGYRVLTVDETPTQIITSGVADIGTLEEHTRQAIQFEMIRLMRANWVAFHNVAEALAATHDTVIVLHDQGELVGRAYFNDTTFDELLDDIGVTREQVTDAYDLAIIMDTGASVGAYDTSNNSARYESAERAASIGARVHAAWGEHPNTTTIPWQINVADKVDLASAAILEHVIAREGLEFSADTDAS